MNRLNEKEYRQILDWIPDVVLIKDIHSRFVWGNAALRELLQMTAEEIKDVMNISYNSGELNAKYIEDDMEVVRTGRQVEIPEEIFIRKNGDRVILHTLKSPVLNEKNEIVGVIAVCREITQKKLAEAALDEQRLQVISASKMSSLGEMASSMAHEINNPLAVIQMHASQLEEMIQEGASTAELVHMTQEIHKTTERISGIIRALKGYSRDDSRDPSQEVEIAKVVEETLRLSSERFRSHEIQLLVTGFEKAGKLEGHSSQLSQVLLNLLNNAHDAIEKMPERWIRLSYREVRGEHQISVEDSGPGIPAHVAERIMSPFFTTKEVGKGTGLGLSISKGIVEAHGGRLWLDPKSSHTCFRITLPITINGERQAAG